VTVTIVGLLILIVLCIVFGVVAARMYRRYRHDMALARERVLAGSQIMETDCGPIEYASVGEGYPVLVIHGAGGGYDQGLLLSQFVSEDVRLIAPSRFGYLRTPLPSNASPAAQADAYVDLLDALDIPQVAVVGISAGGPSALAFASRHPDRTSALVMLSAISHEDPPMDLVQRTVFNVMFGSDFLYWLIATNFQSSLMFTFGVPREVLAELTPAEKDWTSEFLQSLHPVSLRRAGIANDNQQSPRDCRFERISVPTLVIHAVDDSLIDISHGRYTAQNVPGARFLELESGGHILMGQHERVRSEVEAFLKKHTRAGMERRD
jgi:2-hydroxy-6-oxonona-2,4-dienedioate hydrolase